MRVLSTGIDTLNLAAKGHVGPEVWELLDEAQQRARLEEESQPVEFPMTAQVFLIKPHGLRGHAYWLSSPDFELILGRSEKFPPVLVQMHSAYMHSVGIDRALDLMETLLRHEVFAGAYRLNVSRIDVYADFHPEPHPAPPHPRRNPSPRPSSLVGGASNPDHQAASSFTRVSKRCRS